MQALLLPTGSSALCRSCGSRRVQLQSLAAPARRKSTRRGVYWTPQAFGGAAAAFPSEPAGLLSGVSSALGLLLAGGLAWKLAREVRICKQVLAGCGHTMPVLEPVHIQCCWKISEVLARPAPVALSS